MHRCGGRRASGRARACVLRLPAAALALVAGTAAAPPAWGAGNDDVLFVGMNPTGAHEARALGRAGARVTLILDAPEPDRVRAADGTVYNLATEQGAQAFAATLHLPDTQTREVAAAIHAAWPDARDELARIAEAWARTERGERGPARLVLSGHSAGVGVWGGDNGALMFGALGRLAAAMPRAAAGVEDVHAAGCYTGGKQAVLGFVAMFPALKTFWGYWATAPGAYSGATADMALWHYATLGPRSDVNDAVVRYVRRGGDITLWTKSRGFKEGRVSLSLPEARAALERRAPVYDPYFRGERDVTSPQEGELRAYYSALQEVLADPALPAAERATLERRRDQAIRLLYYRAEVAPRFAAAHAAAIQAGFRAVGMTPPDFATLRRGEALAQIAAFGRRARAATPTPPEAAALLPLLEEGLRDLSPRRIPEAWI